MTAHPEPAAEPGRLEPPLLVVSPHLDDAVLSCGRVLAAHPGAVVVTVFSGGRPAAAGLTPWDRDGGFGSTLDPVATRRAEDERALGLLGARPLWLDFVDHQYQPPKTATGVIAGALARELTAVAARTVLVPLGLEHPDHQASAAAALELCRATPHLTWLVYEEGLYRGPRAGAHERAFATLAANELRAVEVRPPADPRPDRKRAALGCYRSQVRACLRHGTPMLAEAITPERYWRLEFADRTRTGESHDFER